MISYKLAKELKEAGFPQAPFAKHPESITAPNDHYCEVCHEKWPPTACSHGQRLYIPTLSELIAACGDEFDYLKQTAPGYWLASGHIIVEMGEEGGVMWDAPQDVDIPSMASPEEAVARLWLALRERL